MRIRRRPADHLSRAQAPPSSSASQPLPPPAVAAPPSCAPAPAAPCCGTSGSPPVEAPAGEADLSRPDATPLSPREPGPQGGEKEEDDASVKVEKRGEEDRRSEGEQYPAAYVALSVRAAAAGAGEEEGFPEAGGGEEEKSTTGFCKKGDGKGWHCKREVQRGYSLCQHHLEKLRSYAGYSQKRSKAKAAPFANRSDAAAAAAAAERQETSQKRTPTSKRKMEEPNVSDSFYYYSGFGPRWGKRRRSRTAQRGTAVGAPDGGAPDVQLLRGAAATGEAEEVSIGDGKPLKSRALSSL